jgi:Alcohol dehydrogenase GroES-like domain
MASNSGRGVVYIKPGNVELQKIDFPSFRNPAGKGIDHGVILKVVTTNICGSDQHMVRRRTTAPAGMVLGHEISGEVIEKGRDVEYLKVGDLVSVPFNVACDRCRTCPEGDTGVCLHVNSDRAGGAFGYVNGTCSASVGEALSPSGRFRLPVDEQRNPFRRLLGQAIRDGRGQGYFGVSASRSTLTSLSISRHVCSST